MGHVRPGNEPVPVDNGMPPPQSYDADHPMDWRSVAALLADREQRPMALLDGTGHVVLVNRGMEQALGWPGDQIEGLPWIDTAVAPGRQRAARQWLHRALSGTVRRSTLEVVSRDRQPLLLDLDLSLVGRRGDQALLVVAESARAPEAVQTSGELDYVIEVGPTTFGTVRRIERVGRVLQAMPGGSCFEVLHGRSAPCTDCPVVVSGGTWPRTAVRRRGSGDGFELITANLAGTDTARITVRLVDDGALSAIQQARLASIADRARLSERERAVLCHLVLGASIDEIATSLKLSRRTVKFHQANLLQKLGADSRADLIRITGF
jgi:PAS domain S-box-containing protein